MRGGGERGGALQRLPTPRSAHLANLRVRVADNTPRVQAQEEVPSTPWTLQHKGVDY